MYLLSSITKIFILNSRRCNKYNVHIYVCIRSATIMNSVRAVWWCAHKAAVREDLHKVLWLKNPRATPRALSASELLCYR